MGGGRGQVSWVEGKLGDGKWTRSFLVTIPLTAAPFVWNRITLAQAASRPVPSRSRSFFHSVCHLLSCSILELLLPLLSLSRFLGNTRLVFAFSGRVQIVNRRRRDEIIDRYFLFLFNWYFFGVSILFFFLNISTWRKFRPMLLYTLLYYLFFLYPLFFKDWCDIYIYIWWCIVLHELRVGSLQKEKCFKSFYPFFAHIVERRETEICVEIDSTNCFERRIMSGIIRRIITFTIFAKIFSPNKDYPDRI